jgi:hypothetical protein
MVISSSHFFISYSRENASLGTGGRACYPGSGRVIVLLSPESNNSGWVRREISFAE